jgi:hypothetical protein
MVKPNKGVVIFGAIMLVVLQVTTVFELFAKAKAQSWRHFAIDLAVLYGLAFATGAIICEAIMIRRRGPT